MANTLTLSTQESAGAQQFQGLFSNVWKVTATVADQDAVAITDTAAFTMTVAGVVLGDMIIGASLTLDASDGTDQAVIRFEVSAANTVTMYVTADAGEFAADSITGATVKLLIGRPAW
jgi:hypothetical protein